MSNGFIVGYGLVKELPVGYNYQQLEDRLLDYDFHDLTVNLVGDQATGYGLAVLVTLERTTVENNANRISNFGVLLKGSKNVELDFEEKRELSTIARVLEVPNKPEWLTATWNY